MVVNEQNICRQSLTVVPPPMKLLHVFTCVQTTERILPKTWMEDGSLRGSAQNMYISRIFFSHFLLQCKIVRQFLTFQFISPGIMYKS